MQGNHRLEKKAKSVNFLEKELLEERLDSTKLEKFPTLWTGSYSNLEKNGSLGWGVSILSAEYSTPREGDFVVIRTKKGNFELGVVGELVKRYDFEDGQSRDYRKLVDSRNAPDIGKMLKRLDVESW